MRINHRSSSSSVALIRSPEYQIAVACAEADRNSIPLNGSWNLTVEKILMDQALRHGDRVYFVKQLKDELER